MKKAVIFVLASIMCFSLFGFGLTPKPVSAEETWQTTVQKGVLDDLVPIGHAGGSYGNASEYGSKLISVAERGTNRGIWELSLAGGWGSRYSYDYTVDLTDFEITFDLSKVNEDGSQIALIFGSKIGDYLNVENGGLGVKTCRHNNQYGIVVSNVSHTMGIEEMTPAPSMFPWDSQNSGYILEADDGILTFSFKKADDNFIVKLNENEYNLPSSVVTDTLGSDLKKVYFAVGAVSDATEIVRIISVKENNSSEYEKTIPAIEEGIEKYVSAAAGSLDTPEKIVNAETLGENSGYENLLRHDKKYYESEIKAAEKKIEEARGALDISGKIALLKADTNKLKEMLDSASTNSALAFAEAYSVAVKEKDVDAIGEVDAEHKHKFEEAVNEYESVVATTEAARKRVVETYVAEYEKLASKIKGVEDLKLVEEYRRDINVNLSKLSSSDKAEIAANLVTIQEKVSELGLLPGWIKSENELTYNGGKFFEFSSVSNSGTLTYEKKFKVNDVSFDISLSGKDGWTAVSLSRKAESFHPNSSNDAAIALMQSNPSLVFMFTRLGENKLSVEIFLIKSTHTSFFSASRGNTVISYKDGENISVKVKAKDDVNSTYAEIFINGEKFNGTPVKNSELKGAIGSDFTGYFSLVKLGSMSMKAEKINGKNATSDKIADLTAEDDASDSSDVSSSDSSGKGDSSSNGKKGCGSDISGEFAVMGAVLVASIAVLKRRKSNI